MSKQIESIINRFSLMPREEQITMVEGIRRRKFVERPATVARKKKVTTAKSNTKKAAAQKLLAGMSIDELEELKQRLLGG